MGGSLKLSQYPAKFGGHRHCGIGDISSLSRDLARPLDQSIM